MPPSAVQSNLKWRKHSCCTGGMQPNHLVTYLPNAFRLSCGSYIILCQCVLNNCLVTLFFVCFVDTESHRFDNAEKKARTQSFVKTRPFTGVKFACDCFDTCKNLAVFLTKLARSDAEKRATHLMLKRRWPECAAVDINRAYRWQELQINIDALNYVDSRHGLLHRRCEKAPGARGVVYTGESLISFAELCCRKSAV